MINNMGLVKKYGKMEINLKANTNLERKWAKANIHGLMGPFIMENGLIMR